MAGIAHPDVLVVIRYPDVPAICRTDGSDLRADADDIPAGAAKRFALEMTELSIVMND
jgi:hypothetical protein